MLHGAHNVAGAQALVDFMLTRRFQEDMPLADVREPGRDGSAAAGRVHEVGGDPPHPYSIDPATISAKRDAWIKEWTDLVVR